MKEDPSPAAAQRVPWHLWLVGILGFLWNSVGSLDYLMIQAGTEDLIGYPSDLCVAGQSCSSAASGRTSNVGLGYVRLRIRAIRPSCYRASGA